MGTLNSTGVVSENLKQGGRTSSGMTYEEVISHTGPSTECQWRTQREELGVSSTLPNQAFISGAQQEAELPLTQFNGAAPFLDILRGPVQNLDYFFHQAVTRRHASLPILGGIRGS